MWWLVGIGAWISASVPLALLVSRTVALADVRDCVTERGAR